MTSAEDASLARGESRIKFSCKWIGKMWDLVSEDEKDRLENISKQFADLLYYEEKLGYAPMAPDGRIGGNGAAVVNISGQSYVLVSKSGKLPGRMNYQKDFCLVSKFDKENWSCEYYSESDTIKPTSDTPMHYSLLKNVKGAFAALHGHAIEKEEVAKSLNIPCSTEETLFSTPADTKAMFSLLEKHPYPSSKIFVRKNHGFYILGKDIDDCRQVLDERLNNPQKKQQQEKQKHSSKAEKKKPQRRREPYSLRFRLKN